jgi:hypothetical protein
MNYGLITTKCNWCSGLKPLVNNKKYCADCKKNMFKECISCHRPLDNRKYFTLNKTRCNACCRKHKIVNIQIDSSSDDEFQSLRNRKSKNLNTKTDTEASNDEIEIDDENSPTEIIIPKEAVKIKKIKRKTKKIPKNAKKVNEVKINEVDVNTHQMKSIMSDLITGKEGENINTTRKLAFIPVFL